MKTMNNKEQNPVSCKSQAKDGNSKDEVPSGISSTNQKREELKKSFSEFMKGLIKPNEYMNLSAEEFKEKIDKLDPEGEVDKKLEEIIISLLQLDHSIQFCETYSPGTESYKFHRNRIDFLNKILNDYAWFDELKMKNKKFSFLEHLSNN
jgi:hypothetical protein